MPDVLGVIRRRGHRGIVPEQVAAEAVGVAEKPQLPLRVPIGEPARALLAARQAAPDDVPFIMGPAER